MYVYDGNRDNHRLNAEIESLIDMWDGTSRGQSLKNMYENGTSYEAICDFWDTLDYEDYQDD